MAVLMSMGPEATATGTSSPSTSDMFEFLDGASETRKNM